MTSGTIGEAKRLEGIKISLATEPMTGGIEYQTHVENIGWMNTVSDGRYPERQAKANGWKPSASI